MVNYPSSNPWSVSSMTSAQTCAPTASDQTKPSVTLTAKTSTLKATSQTATLKCSD